MKKKVTFEKKILCIGTLDECITYRNTNFKTEQHPHVVVGDCLEDETLTPVTVVTIEEIAASHGEETQTVELTLSEKKEKLFALLQPIDSVKKQIDEILESIAEDDKDMLGAMIVSDERFAPYLALIGA